jgi:hypothetical protein
MDGWFGGKGQRRLIATVNLNAKEAGAKDRSACTADGELALPSSEIATGIWTRGVRSTVTLKEQRGSNV